ncbi:MAG: ATP-binding protein [Lentisphaeria bacterium]
MPANPAADPDRSRLTQPHFSGGSHAAGLHWRLHQTEKMAAIGQLVAGIAHELNSPLTAILGFAELAADPATAAAARRECLDDILQEARRAAELVEILLHVSRRPATQRRPVALHNLLDRCVKLVGLNFNSLGLKVIRKYEPGLPQPLGDENQLQQVFLNLLLNAAQALAAHAGTGAAPAITVATACRPDRRQIGITIADNGPGIAPVHLPHIFEPFFTTKLETGTGLGLSVAREILRRQGGELAAESPPEGGARFLVTLPLEPPAAP